MSQGARIHGTTGSFGLARGFATGAKYFFFFDEHRLVSSGDAARVEIDDRQANAMTQVQTPVQDDYETRSSKESVYICV